MLGSALSKGPALRGGMALLAAAHGLPSVPVWEAGVPAWGPSSVDQDQGRQQLAVAQAPGAGRRGLHTSTAGPTTFMAGSATQVAAHQPLEPASFQATEAAVAAAAGVESGAALVEFTPDQSAVGGALIGLAAASKLGFTGMRTGF